MTDELAALLDAIYEAPDDDAPRLVYADALIERGDPRGEFIARQLRGDQAGELLAQHARTWLRGIASLLSQYTFERGFLATCVFAPQPELGAIERAVGLPIWSTVREYRGPLAIALAPAMRALRVLWAYEPALEHWKELLAGDARPITELHYTARLTETWDPGGDVTATPQSGGVWYREFSRDEIAALATCSALPSLRRLVVDELPPNWLAIVLAGSILDRLQVFEWQTGGVHLRISQDLAVITTTASPIVTDLVLELARALPAHIGIQLSAPASFIGRPIIERVLGSRLRR